MNEITTKRIAADFTVAADFMKYRIDYNRAVVV